MNSREKAKLRKRLKTYSDIQVQKESIKIYYSKKYSIKEIKDMNLKEYLEFNTIAYNIDSINLDELKKYILNKLEELNDETQSIKSELRRLILIYDLKKNTKK